MQAQSSRRGRSAALVVDTVTGTYGGNTETVTLVPGLLLSDAQSQIATTLSTTVDKVTFKYTYKYV